MRRVLDAIETVGPTDANVLITGESGTGKELVVRAIHAASMRRFHPLVVIHCGAGPIAGEHTGPEPVGGLLDRHPGLRLVIAHMGMPEYRAFLDVADRFERVHLDTTMFATDFTQRLMPFDPADLTRLTDLRDRIVLGTDFPSIPYRYAHQLAALARLGLGDDWLRAVLWSNGARLFELEA